MLRPEDRDATVDSIEALQLPSGQIPWFPGGHADPWNHVEAAMALTIGGRRSAAERAFGWLQDMQLPDGSWFNYYVGDDVEDARRDTNVTTYVAVGVLAHARAWKDDGFVAELFPTVARAMTFALSLQQATGEVLWSLDPDGTPGEFALLTGSSSVLLSLRCAVAVAELAGEERPEWELAADRLAAAISRRPDRFAPKERWAMDWYYPVLSGAVTGDAGRERLLSRWDEFVMPGLGVRCVSDRDWVTAAETAECVMALDAVGLGERARTLFEWAQHLRDDDGSYWTGCAYPEAVHFPGGERSSYTAAAIVLADHVLDGADLNAGLFRGEGLPPVVPLEDDAARAGDRT